MTAQPITEAQARAARARGEALHRSGFSDLTHGEMMLCASMLWEEQEALLAWREAAIPLLRAYREDIADGDGAWEPRAQEQLAALDALLPEPPSP